MAWLAVAAGANGLGFFAWDERLRDAKTGDLKGWFTPEHPEQIEDLREVLAELRSLEAVLLAPRAAKQPVPAPRNPAVHALLKESGGKRWLIAVNDSRRVEETVLRLDGAANSVVRRIDRIGDEHTAFSEDALPLKLPPLGVVVFEFQAGNR